LGEFDSFLAGGELGFAEGFKGTGLAEWDWSRSFTAIGERKSSFFLLLMIIFFVWGRFPVKKNFS